jgi:hypothetical protein
MGKPIWTEVDLYKLDLIDTLHRWLYDPNPRALPSKYLFLRGAPGSGKTFDLRMFARKILTFTKSDKKLAIPMFLDCKRFIYSMPNPLDVTVLDIIKKHCEKVRTVKEDDLDTMVDRYITMLATGKIFLILDHADLTPTLLKSISELIRLIETRHEQGLRNQKHTKATNKQTKKRGATYQFIVEKLLPVKLIFAVNSNCINTPSQVKMITQISNGNNEDGEIRILPLSTKESYNLLKLHGFNKTYINVLLQQLEKHAFLDIIKNPEFLFKTAEHFVDKPVIKKESLALFIFRYMRGKTHTQSWQLLNFSLNEVFKKLLIEISDRYFSADELFLMVNKIITQKNTPIQLIGITIHLFLQHPLIRSKTVEGKTLYYVMIPFNSLPESIWQKI